MDPRSAVTAHRRTHLKLGVPRSILRTPGYALSRTYREIARLEPIQQENVAFLDGIGWTLAPHAQFRAGFRELSSMQGAALLPGQGAQGAPFLGQAARSRQETDYDPMAGSYPAGYPSVGDVGLQAQVSASFNPADRELSADRLAYPGPTLGNDRIPLDRVLVSEELHQPDQAVHFVLDVPPGSRGGLLARVYFSGPAGDEPGWTGRGQYCLELDEAKGAQLYERGTETRTGLLTWRLVFGFGFREPNTSVYSVSIFSDARLTSAGWTGSHLTIYINARGDGLMGVLLNSLVAAAQSNLGYAAGMHLYAVPRRPGQTLTTQTERLRVDLRRDTRAWFRLSTTRYPGSGELQGDPFSPGVLHGDTWTLTHEFYGRVPSGAGLTARLVDLRTGEECPITSGPNAVGDNGFWQNHQVPAGARELVPIYTLSGDGTETPWLEDTRFFADPQVVITDPDAVEVPVTRYQLTKSSDAVSEESGWVDVHDTQGEVAARVAGDTQLPFLIETEWDPQDPAKRSILMGGYAKTMGVQVGTEGRSEARLAGPSWWRFRLALEPEASRLSSGGAASTLNFMAQSDYSAQGSVVPYKVTDILRWAIRNNGFDPLTIDIPDSAMRLFNTEARSSMLDGSRRNTDLIEFLAAHYLQSFLVIDFNARNEGMPYGVPLVRVKPYPRAPYRYMAEFLSSAPERESTPVHHAGLYETELGLDGQPMLRTFIQRGTFSRPMTSPPIANELVITSAPPSRWVVPARRLQTVVRNFRSAKFFAEQPIEPDPNSPDYLGTVQSMTVVDKAAASEEALRWMARSYFRMLCHGHRRVRLTAPLLLVTDISDAKQFQPRPLHFGDMVKVDGEPWMIRHVTIHVDGERGGDRIQMATYELQTVPPEFEIAEA